MTLPLFCFERQTVTVRPDFDFLARLELPRQQLRRERVEQVWLEISHRRQSA